MSTSDRDWRLWQPESLLDSFESPVIEPSQTDALAVVDPASEAQFQAELARLRQQAEREGYATGERNGLEEGQTRGYREGFNHGRAEGLAQGTAEANTQQRALISRFTLLVDEFQAALDSLDSVIPARLVQLSLNAVRSMLGKQIVCDTSVLLEKIRQLLQENLQFTNQIELWVSDEDLPMVQEHLGEMLQGRGWALHADAKMVPGGCRITAEEGELDGSLSANWQMLCNLAMEDYH
ncbi:flagellar assembly protein FliH [Kosakonia arachidis]|uniref:Flagellar assembly protein FliH n=1 Tax=Kosakonia arachidis TaxID=551989 RepID=A0A1I7E864_9ENTR|nr:flagellar assembly protein FliH [Kosakonia arachidis]SFU20138.1 flagellar assembly protein FliH [Kosakonia arachidis]